MSRSYHVTWKEVRGKSRTEIEEMICDPNSALRELAEKSKTKKQIRIQRNIDKRIGTNANKNSY